MHTLYDRYFRKTHQKNTIKGLEKGLVAHGGGGSACHRLAAYNVIPHRQCIPARVKFKVNTLSNIFNDGVGPLPEKRKQPGIIHDT